MIKTPLPSLPTNLQKKKLKEVNSFPRAIKLISGRPKLQSPKLPCPVLFLLNNHSDSRESEIPWTEKIVMNSELHFTLNLFISSRDLVIRVDSEYLTVKYESYIQSITIIESFYCSGNATAS